MQYFRISGLCVIKIMVFSGYRFVMFFITFFSVSSSKKDVASSIMRMLHGFNNALAMLIRWACPSESPLPPSPHGISSPFSELNTKLAHAAVSALTMSVSVVYSFPRIRLLFMVPFSNVFPCGTYEKLLRDKLVSDKRVVLLYISMHPFWGCRRESTSLIKVVFPLPVSPTIAVLLCGVKLYEKFSKI